MKVGRAYSGNPDRSRGEEEGRSKDGETIWWRIEERHEQGMPPRWKILNEGFG